MHTRANAICYHIRRRCLRKSDRVWPAFSSSPFRARLGMVSSFSLSIVCVDDNVLFFLGLPFFIYVTMRPIMYVLTYSCVYLLCVCSVMVPDEGYLKSCFDLCREHNVLFIADEIQTVCVHMRAFLSFFLSFSFFFFLQPFNGANINAPHTLTRARTHTKLLVLFVLFFFFYSHSMAPTSTLGWFAFEMTRRYIRKMRSGPNHLWGVILIWIGVILYTVTVGISRSYLGVHYLRGKSNAFMLCNRLVHVFQSILVYLN